jgi:ArsR family metal-binding transcriptional regulator
MNDESSGLDRIAVFAAAAEFETARALLLRLCLPFQVVSPDPAYSLVGSPALFCDAHGLSAILGDSAIVCAGWTEARVPSAELPSGPPERFDEDLFLKAAIMYYGPCVADETRIRLIAHLAGDLTPVLPYLNGTLPQASFNARSSTLTFMDGRRLITLYPRRIAIGKADGLVDGWRTLERIRILANRTWARHAELVPSSVLRAKPPVLEIYKRLPRTNCGDCGEQTCMAFAASLWQGRSALSRCRPVFTEEHAALRAALVEICHGLGLEWSGEVNP